MEGEIHESKEPNQDVETPQFLRVEFDGEHKIFVKECSECGNTFSTGVPKRFFKNPDDDSVALHPDAKDSGIEKIISNLVCPDTKRNAAAKEKV